MRPEVKICGLKKPADAQYVNDAGADYAGFVFYEKSRRNLSRQQAEEIMKKITLWYDCEVVFTDQSLKDMRLSGNMRRYDSVEKILHYLEITTGAKFAVKGRTIFVGK